MQNIVSIILILIVVISTLGVCITKPEMHSKVYVFDSSYVIEQDEKTKEEPIVVTEKISQNIVEKPIEKSQIKTVKKQENISSERKIEKKEKPITKEKTQTQQIAKTTVTPKAENKVQQTAKSTVQENKTHVSAPKPTISQLSEEEEIIAWNKWHSDIQNSLMHDVKMPILPNGIVFNFSFTVDKYGKITNIHTSSTTPQYTPYAIEYIAPVIRSYQGRSIVEFPKGSKRTITTFKGAWKMSNQAKYSRPEDYNDSEVIRK